MPFESFTEEIPVNHGVFWKSLPMLIPPDTCWTL